MNIKRFTDAELKKRRKAYLDAHRDERNAKQVFYRYPRSIQKIVDDHWEILKVMTNRELFVWAVNYGFALRARKMICFWLAVRNNFSIGQKLIEERIKECAEHERKVKKRNSN